MTILDDDLVKDFAGADGWFVPASAVSEPMAKTIDETIRRTRHGGTVDIIARIDGIEYRLEADWVKYMRRAPALQHQGSPP